MARWRGCSVRAFAGSTSQRDNVPSRCELAEGDLRPTPTGRIVCEALRGAMPDYLETGLNIVHVDDVAMGRFSAMERAKIGERYITGHESVLHCDSLRMSRTCMFFDDRKARAELGRAAQARDG